MLGTVYTVGSFDDVNTPATNENTLFIIQEVGGFVMYAMNSEREIAFVQDMTFNPIPSPTS